MRHYTKVDIHAEELGNNTNNAIKVQADLKSFCEQVKKEIFLTTRSKNK